MTEKEFEEKNLSFRSKEDHKLDKTKPIILMLDGRAFSKFTKQFNVPFDDDFVEMMDETAKYLCKNIQNATFAFTQSDEISIYLKPCEGLTEPWFGGRLNKICSVAAGMASSFFTSRYIAYQAENKWSDSDGVFDSDIISYLLSTDIPTFDCKAWNVPSYEEVEDWFKYRQKDCLRNSKQQFAQAYAPHKSLLNMNCDNQIKLVKESFGQDWNTLDHGLKFGRFAEKNKMFLTNEFGSFERTIWEINENFKYETYR